MTYTQTLDYMFSQLPMYHRIGAAAYKNDLRPTEDLMTYLGHPERQFPSIHVAGTNGKGSVSHLLASTLQEAGYRVGLYTSPHLVDFRERIRIDGQMIPQQAVVDFIERHRRYLDAHQLSFFEMTVGMAFDYFAQQEVDVAVVEVGMGGRLDSTNVVASCLSVITNIGLDHTQFLGTTLPQIAAEKAGIIKYGVPVVVGETNADTQPVFIARAAEQEAPIVYADQHFSIVDRGSDASMLRFDVQRDGTTIYADLRCPLAGSYQLRNLATFFQAVELLDLLDYDRITGLALRRGIERVQLNTGLHGRWEVIAERPLTICETAHNADGIRAMLAKLDTLQYSHLRIVYGCVNDKDFGSILQMLPAEASFYFTQPSVPRALPVDQLAATAAQLGISGPCFATVAEAIAAAQSEAAPEDLILVTGSIFLVADALQGRI